MQSKTPSSQYFEALSAEIEEGARVRSRLQRLKDDSMRRLQLLQDEKSDTLARLEVSTFDELTISPSDSKNTTIDHIVDKHNGISMNESQSAAHCGTKRQQRESILHVKLVMEMRNPESSYGCTCDGSLKRIKD